MWSISAKNQKNSYKTNTSPKHRTMIHDIGPKFYALSISTTPGSLRPLGKKLFTIFRFFGKIKIAVFFYLNRRHTSHSHFRKKTLCMHILEIHCYMQEEFRRNRLGARPTFGILNFKNMQIFEIFISAQNFSKLCLPPLNRPR